MGLHSIFKASSLTISFSAPFLRIGAGTRRNAPVFWSREFREYPVAAGAVFGGFFAGKGENIAAQLSPFFLKIEIYMFVLMRGYLVVFNRGMEGGNGREGEWLGGFCAG